MFYILTYHKGKYIKNIDNIQPISGCFYTVFCHCTLCSVTHIKVLRTYFKK